ncbi:MAG: FAD-binding oxidoreductase [Chloroflexota bacterium]
MVNWLIGGYYDLIPNSQSPIPNHQLMTKINVNNINHGNPGPAGWNVVLAEPAPARLLDKQITADFLVIGGGFTGLAAARRLSQNEPEAKIVLVDAIRIGDGSAGRSSGFMIDLPHDLNSNSYTGASEEDIRQTAMLRTAVSFAAEAAEEYEFPKETFDLRGKVYAAATPSGDKHNHEYAEHLIAMGEKPIAFSAAEMQKMTGTDYYTSGLFTAGTAMIQPAGYVRGIAKGLADKVDIYENSPVLSLEKKGKNWLVKTPKGSVSVSKIILAVNGHMQSFGFMKGRLMHIFLYASMTRPLTPAELSRLGGDAQWDLVPADQMGSTVRKFKAPDGVRIVVRNRFKFSSKLEASEQSVQSVIRDHDNSFRARFPMLPDVTMEHRWGGRLCLSWNGVQVFGELEDGLYAATVQNGLGASKGTLSGILAADYASGRDNEYITDYLNFGPPPRIPPEPIANVGATAFHPFKEWQAGREL